MSRATHPPSGHSLSHPSGLPHQRVAAALCVELYGLDGGSDDTFR
jgi:hypothetical protein